MKSLQSMGFVRIFSDSIKIKDKKTILKHYIRQFSSFPNKDSLDEIMPDHLIYNIPKYSKNTKDFDFPWLYNGAPFLEIKARFLPEQVFIRSFVPKSEVLKHLF